MILYWEVECINNIENQNLVKERCMSIMSKNIIILRNAEDYSKNLPQNLFWKHQEEVSKEGCPKCNNVLPMGQWLMESLGFVCPDCKEFHNYAVHYEMATGKVTKIELIQSKKITEEMERERIQHIFYDHLDL